MYECEGVGEYMDMRHMRVGDWHVCAPVCEHTCVYIRPGKGGGAAAILPPEGRHPLERRQTATLFCSSGEGTLPF